MNQYPGPPTISVVLPTFNNAATIRAAVSSIIRQTYRHWELLVIDDGSTDNTQAELRVFQDERIRVVADGARRGLPTRLNDAIRMAQGTYVARMDGDDFSYPERLEKQLAYLHAHPGTDLVAGWALFFEHPDRALGVFRAPEFHAALCSGMPRILPLIHPTWLARKDWFLRFPYDPDFRRIEDQDLLFRAMPSSVFACAQEVVLAYRIHRGQFRRVKNEALDQRYHLHLHTQFLLQRRKPALALRVALTRGAKTLYRPIFAAIGLARYMHQRSLSRPTLAELSRFQALVSNWRTSPTR